MAYFLWCKIYVSTFEITKCLIVMTRMLIDIIRIFWFIYFQPEIFLSAAILSITLYMLIKRDQG